MNSFVVSAICAFLSALFISIFVFLKGHKSPIRNAFIPIAFLAGFWCLFPAAASLSSSPEITLFLVRIVYISALFTGPAFLTFGITMAGAENKKFERKLIYLSYTIGILFLFVLFSPLLIRGVLKYKPYFALVVGPVYPIFILFFATSCLYSFYRLAIAFKTTVGQRKNQIKYIFIAYLFAFLSAVVHFGSAYGLREMFPHDILVITCMALLAYAVITYRLVDVNIGLMRAGIFIVVYALVLGFPFLLGYKYGLWKIATWVMLFLATLGPFIYLFLQRRAENALLKDQRRYQTALTELSETMTRIRDINKLLEDIVSTITTTAKISSIAIFLKDEEYKSYRLKAYHPADLKSSLPELISLDDPVVSLLSKEKRLLLLEEMGPLKNLGPNPGLLLPCFMEDNLLCFIILGTKPNNQIYTQDDTVVFEMLSYSTALAIENSIFWEEIQDRQRKERIKEMDIYAYSLAHEIHNPMQIVMGSYYTLKPKVENSELTEENKKSMLKSLEFLREAAQRVNDMVEAIRAFGSRTSGELKPLEIKDVVESFIQVYMPQFKTNGVVLTREIPAEPIFVRGEKNELITILINFAKNSMHAMESSREKKAIVKVMRTNADFVRISFADTGHGIPKEKILTIFAPFVTTKASSVGTGMGLYNVVKLANHNKGKVWAESEGENKGATLVLELPIAKDIKESDLLKKDGIRSKWKF